MNDTFTIGEKKCKEKLNWNRQHLKNIKKIAKEKGITLE